MNTISEFPAMPGQKVTVLKQNDTGFYYAMQITIETQGNSFYSGYPDAPFFTYHAGLGKKKSRLMISIIPSTVIAIYPGHFNINTDDPDGDIFCFDIEHFERMTESIKVTPLFIYYKKDD